MGKTMHFVSRNKDMIWGFQFKCRKLFNKQQFWYSASIHVAHKNVFLSIITTFYCWLSLLIDGSWSKFSIQTNYPLSDSWWTHRISHTRVYHQGALATETKRCVFQIPCEMQHDLRLIAPRLQKKRNKWEWDHSFEIWCHSASKRKWHLGAWGWLSADSRA